MKRFMLCYVFVAVSALLIFTCSVDNATAPEIGQAPEISQNDQLPDPLAKKPSPNLTGTANTPFTFTPPTFWNGTVDFGVDGIYGLTFVSYEPPRPFSQASPYNEDFIIYELGTDWTIPENVYLKGWNAGVVTYANNPPDPCKFRANGKITEAYGPFEEWQGRNVHIRGLVYWAFENGLPTGLPERAEGTFRIN